MPLHEGENVGPYRVMGQLGQGGMATVYQAYHAQLNRYVAIKMMHTAFQENENFHARFRREAQIVALLEHPHIVPVYDFNDYQNQPYLVMKFIEGKTLKGTLVDGALTLQQVLHVMTAVASALTYAHSKGVLHRDIKPSNVVIDNDNVPYLTDFGLARIAEAGESTLSADMILGTPHYISPEQALGVKSLTAGTDIYSLGVVLYELVVGRVPFSADTPYAIIHDHIYTPLPMPSHVNPDIPPGVEMVLLKALAKDPEDRYASAVEMVEAFKQAVSDSGLSELKSDRVSNAAVSLARLRHAMNSQLIAGSTLDVPGISSPMLPTSSASQILRQRQRERRWMWGGIAAFFAICGLSGFITLNAMNTLRNLGDRFEVNFTEEVTTPSELPPAVTPDAPFGTSGARGGEPLVTRLVIPELSLEDAQAAIDDDPNSAEAYLALAIAQTNREDARAALIDGLAVTDDQISYLMTAGDVVAQNGELEIAAVMYLSALSLAEGTEIYPDVRAEVGHYLYDVTAAPPAIDFPVFMALAQRQENLPELDRNFINTFGTRNMFNHEGTRSVLTRMEPLVNRPDALAEAHLVYGEALLTQGDNEVALEQLNLAFNADDAPQWVRHRAEELIATIEE